MKPIDLLASTLAASFLLSTHAGCVASISDGAGVDDNTASEGNAATSEALLWRFHRRPRRPPTGTAGTGAGSGGSGTSGSSGSGGSGGSGSSCSAPTGNIDAIIAAAQTPDGSAIPQASLPGGCCPQVVAALGFWSCPTIGDACMYSASGATHHCTCSRVDGEGQLPAWVCD